MTEKYAPISVTFVKASDVRRYAHEEALSEDKRKTIEQALLDDDCARRIVKNEGVRALEEIKLTDAQKEQLWLAGEICRLTVVQYELLSRNDRSKSISAFAEESFQKRWLILQEMQDLLASAGGDRILVSDGDGKIEAGKPTLSDRLESTAILDRMLAKRLNTAFEEASQPAMKAKIAEWIAQIQAAADRLEHFVDMLSA